MVHEGHFLPENDKMGNFFRNLWLAETWSLSTLNIVTVYCHLWSLPICCHIISIYINCVKLTCFVRKKRIVLFWHRRAKLQNNENWQNSGTGAKLAGRRLSRNELRTEIIKLILSWEFRSFNFVYGNLFIYFSGQFCSTENRMTVSKMRVPTWACYKWTTFSYKI